MKRLYKASKALVQAEAQGMLRVVVAQTRRSDDAVMRRSSTGSPHDEADRKLEAGGLMRRSTLSHEPNLTAQDVEFLAIVTKRLISKCGTRT